jgi:hypothetical protein
VLREDRGEELDRVGHGLDTGSVTVTRHLCCHRGPI